MNPNGPTGSAARPRGQLAEKDRPPGIVSVRAILNEEIREGRFTSVIGLVKDMRAPMPTNGTDWKSTLTLFDKSTEDGGDGLDFYIFRPEHEMPHPSVGDVVLVYSAKVYRYRGNGLSIISNRTTEITVFAASEIPRPPNSAIDAAKSTRAQVRRPPTDKECEYVSWLYHASDKSTLPSVAEFHTNVERSRNIKDKYCTLKDVQELRFCDLIVQVVKDPYDQMDKVCLWVTDYTENESFFGYAWDGSDAPGGRDGDPFGYIAVNSNVVSRSWLGPYGKRSMQITCYEPHASYLRENVKFGDWVKLRNVQIKFGHNGSNLEGFLREDRGSFSSKIAVEVLDTSGTGHVDDRLKEAIRRKRDYEKTAKRQKKAFVATENTKRKSEEPIDTKTNARQRRKAQRAATNKRLVEAETSREHSLALNELIRCESLDEPVFPLSTILEPVVYTTNIDGQKVDLKLPFTNAKYRANVRVVDYRPRKLEDFAVWRKVTEYDMLSDYDGASESESDDDRGTLNAFAGQKTWEWCFALQLEQGGLKPGETKSPERLWAIVNNTEAQLLMNMDACDLRANPDELLKMSEQLFKLWGNLQEHKEQELKAQIQSRRRLAANEAPPDSSDAEDDQSRQNTGLGPVIGKVSNKSFTCCLRQYGITVPESDLMKWDAGEGKRYERMFGLFGTKIS